MEARDHPPAPPTTSTPPAPAPERARIAVLVSGGGSNLQAIIEACAAGTIDGDVVVVASNVADAYGLTRASAAGIPTATVAKLAGEPRAEYDRRLAAEVVAFEPEIVVLAGWMRILTMAFLGRFPQRVINLHPALPGELSGTRAIERAFNEARDGTRKGGTGVMVHLVPDEGVDDGPVLGTVEVPIYPADTLEHLTTRVHAAEHELLVQTLARLCAQRQHEEVYA